MRDGKNAFYRKLQLHSNLKRLISFYRVVKWSMMRKQKQSSRQEEPSVKFAE